MSGVCVKCGHLDHEGKRCEMVVARSFCGPHLYCKCGGPPEDAYVISVDGREVARVSGEGIECAKKQVDKWSEEMVDDPKLLRLQRDGKTILVFYVSAMENVTVEKVSE